MKLSNIELYGGVDEWCIKLYFGNAHESIWLYKGMSPRQILQVFLCTIKKLVDNFPLG